MWPHRTRRNQARTLDHVDPSPRDHPSTHLLRKETKWIRSRALPVDVWTHHGHLISIRQATREARWRVRSSSHHDQHRTADVLSRRTTIVARSWPDRRTIVARSPPRSSPIATSEATFMEARRSQLDCLAIKARSPRDRGPIAARSCPRSGLIQCQSGEDSSRD